MLHVRRSYVVIALKSEGGKEISSILADKYCIILINEAIDTVNAGVTKKCRLSWLTNSALVYERPNAGDRGLRGLSKRVQLCSWSPNKLWRSNSIFNLCKNGKGQNTKM
jgi:hypothetical protein